MIDLVEQLHDCALRHQSDHSGSPIVAYRESFYRPRAGWLLIETDGVEGVLVVWADRRCLTFVKPLDGHTQYLFRTSRLGTAANLDREIALAVEFAENHREAREIGPPQYLSLPIDTSLADWSAVRDSLREGWPSALVADPPAPGKFARVGGGLWMPPGSGRVLWWFDSFAAADDLLRTTTSAPRPLPTSHRFTPPPVTVTGTADVTHAAVEQAAAALAAGAIQRTVTVDLKTGSKLYTSIMLTDGIPFAGSVRFDFRYPVRSGADIPMRIVFDASPGPHAIVRVSSNPTHATYTSSRYSESGSRIGVRGSRGMAATFAVRINNAADSEWRCPQISVRDDVRAVLGRMDGVRFFAYLLWRVPDGRSVDQEVRRATRTGGPSTFLQTAGQGDALCVEVRVDDDSGPRGHWSVGRRGEPTAPMSTVTWAVERYTHDVPSNELFDAAGAAEVFEDYVNRGGRLDWDRWSLRRTFPDSGPRDVTEKRATR